ncbi:hypothetical protein Pelo_15104 [Pelomyxa schiedti]|nr:hypothetical protein Pelo_15104 [Pelomyxa schiedti]
MAGRDVEPQRYRKTQVVAKLQQVAGHDWGTEASSIATSAADAIWDLVELAKTRDLPTSNCNLQHAPTAADATCEIAEIANAVATLSHKQHLQGGEGESEVGSGVGDAQTQIQIQQIAQGRLGDVCRDTVTRLPAELWKEEGNKWFMAGEYLKAIQLYGMAIDYLKSVPEPSTHSKKLLAVILGNRAQCYIKVSRFAESVRDSKESIVLDTIYEKGHYRLAFALNEMQDKIGALEATRVGLRQVPNSDDLRKLYDKIASIRPAAAPVSKPTTGTNYEDQLSWAIAESLRLEEEKKKADAEQKKIQEFYETTASTNRTTGTEDEEEDNYGMGDEEDNAEDDSE